MNRIITAAEAIAIGYDDARTLPNGETLAVHRMIYTVGLFIGLHLHGFRTRFCYPDMGSALKALRTWDGEGDPPGPWIKEKGAVERLNPNFIKETTA
jgi:hypothetical protein